MSGDGKPDARFGVWIHEQRAGRIYQWGDYTRFVLDSDYILDPEREVLGLAFEDNPDGPYSSHLRVIPWFSNLLPEGYTRELIAHERGVSPDREMELLAHVGQDLPGAVYIRPDLDDRLPGADEQLLIPLSSERATKLAANAGPGWRFSLAGVGLKFSMLMQGARLTLPGSGETGEWIVKLPHQVFDLVPQNEYAMMNLASLAGIKVPEIKLVHRDELAIGDRYWRSNEEYAFAAKRFDRVDGRRIHIEDLAQVREFYAEDKYKGTYETVAAIIYRNRDVEALREFARRLTFCALIENSDAHLKNWSLIYTDPRVPTLSPAYDLASTTPYGDLLDDAEHLALKWANAKPFSRFRMRGFTALEERLGAEGAELESCAVATVEQALRYWPQVRDALAASSYELAEKIDSGIRRSAEVLLRRNP